MNKSANLFPLFGAAFAVAYVPVLLYNLALFTYFPALGVWRPLNPPPGPNDGPGMYWYGIIVTSALIAAGVTVIGAFVPETTRNRVWGGFSWLIPILAMAYVFWILKGYFFR